MEVMVKSYKQSGEYLLRSICLSLLLAILAHAEVQGNEKTAFLSSHWKCIVEITNQHNLLASHLTIPAKSLDLASLSSKVTLHLYRH